MRILDATRPNVKPAAFAVIFAPSFIRKLANPLFGILPQRERRLPIGPSARDLDAIKGECPATAPTDAEYRAYVESRTMTAADYHAAMDEMAEIARHRDMADLGLCSY